MNSFFKSMLPVVAALVVYDLVIKAQLTRVTGAVTG